MKLDAITTEKVSGAAGVSVSVLRLDRIDPAISGNKWFKLKYYLQDAIASQKKIILTFGGAYSNHLVATAAACQLNKLQSIGIVRGEMPATLSHTLLEARTYGMKLYFTGREEYRQKNIPAEVFKDHDRDQLYTINEGGYGEKGAQGCREILEFCNKNEYTHICCACGTGTMLAGLVMAAPTAKLIGISVLKNNFSLPMEVDRILPASLRSLYHLIHDYHFGGYAKYTGELIAFMNEFYRANAIPTDFVYTGKLLYAIADLAGKNYFPASSNILVIHSGGLQGNNSLARGTLIF